MQAARGTPVGDQPTERRRLWLLFAAVALTAYAVDVVTKILAVDRLTGRPDVQVIGEVLQLHLTFNPGAAFSAGTGLTPVLSVIAIIAALVVLWLSRRVGSTGWAVALGFLLAGVAGNLTDRMLREPGPFHGEVVDFLMLPNWPIFNVADICINVAAGLIVIQAFRGIRIDGTHERDHAEPSSGESAPDDSGPDDHVTDTSSTDSRERAE